MSVCPLINLDLVHARGQLKRDLQPCARVRAPDGPPEPASGRASGLIGTVLRAAMVHTARVHSVLKCLVEVRQGLCLHGAGNAASSASQLAYAQILGYAHGRAAHARDVHGDVQQRAQGEGV